jgi:protein-S-isoprenylcysteine O-methyltransferase Ste14
MTWLEHRIPPPLVGLAIAAGMAWLAPQLPRLTGVPELRPALAMAIGAVGVAIDFAALLQFRRVRTTVNPLRPDRANALVTGGVFRYSRNPMYLGLLLVLVAWAVHLASPPALLGPVLFVLYVGRYQIAPEERVMARRFGAEYEAYRGRVRRWL